MLKKLKKMPRNEVLYFSFNEIQKINSLVFSYFGHWLKRLENLIFKSIG